MTPLKVKAFLSTSKPMALKDIAKQFGIGIALASNLVDFWVKRGCCMPIPSCSSCKLCDQNVQYQWIAHA